MGSLTIRIGAADAGERLDRVLAGPLGSRAQAVRAIEAGRVRVDGREARKGLVLSEGAVLEVAAAPSDPTPPPAAGAPVGELRVVWEDGHLLVVDKPAGLVVHPARGHPTGTLVQALAGRAAGGGDPARPGIVHRLDRDTSGLLVVARSEPAHRALTSLLAQREIHREYLALVDGIPPARTGTVEAPIGRDRRDRTIHSIDTDAPRSARTHFEVLESPGGRSALLRLLLDTGRTHQIRVHLASIGHPVVGDRTYGGPMRFGLERQFLHAARLSFTHPMTGEELDVEAPLPADLVGALQTARGRDD